MTRSWSVSRLKGVKGKRVSSSKPILIFRNTKENDVCIFSDPGTIPSREKSLLSVYNIYFILFVDTIQVLN